MGDPMSRRSLGKLLLAVPAASLSARGLGAETPSDEVQFFASHEPGLSPEERERLQKGLADLEKSLKTVRDFTLSNDVSPALRFRAMPSRRT
jgi:hypothetical protein